MPVKKKSKAKPKKTAAKTAKKPVRKAAAKKTTVKKAAKKTTKAKAKAKPKVKVKAKAKPKTKAKAKPKTKVKRKPNAAFMKPMTPDAALAAVVGSKPIPRTEITKKIWIYIKKHDLQDPKNRRMINADANLAGVFGKKKQVSMFEMTKLISKHMS